MRNDPGSTGSPPDRSTDAPTEFGVDTGGSFGYLGPRRGTARRGFQGGSPMKLIRFRINRLMIVVAVVAANLGVMRALFASRRVDILCSGAVLWSVLQVGVARIVRRRGR